MRSPTFRELRKLTVDAQTQGSCDDVSVEEKNQLVEIQWQPPNVLDLIFERQQVIPQQKDKSRH